MRFMPLLICLAAATPAAGRESAHELLDSRALPELETQLDYALRGTRFESSQPLHFENVILDNGIAPCLPTHGNQTVGPVPQALGPYVEEAGEWTLSRLTPGATIDTPVVIDEVRYYLAHTPGLDFAWYVADLPHQVRLFVGPSDSTPDGLDPIETLDVAPTNSVPGYNLIELSIDPITIEPGESLFVAIQMTADLAADTSLALLRCLEGTPAQADYWASMTQAPFTWTPLSAWGLGGANTMIQADGWRLVGAE